MHECLYTCVDVLFVYMYEWFLFMYDDDFVFCDAVCASVLFAYMHA